MRDLSAIIDRIQAVRAARRRFLRLWRVERAPVCLTPAGLDRLAADIARADNIQLAGGDLTCTQERTILKTRTSWLYPHGRLADEWE